MSVDKTRYARVIFAFMVPLTMVAFIAATFIEPSVTLANPDWMDVAAMLVVAFGVWLYNWYEEKPQVASIEKV